MARGYDVSTIRRKGLLAAVLLTCVAARAQSVLQITTPLFPLTPVGQSVTENVLIGVAPGGNSVVFNSIALANGTSDFAMGTITGCVVDGLTPNTDGTVCTVPITFTPTRAGNAGSPQPIARAVPLAISDTENGNNEAYQLGIVGSGTVPTPVVVPGSIADLVGNDTALQTGYGGDGGPANGAVFNMPTNMAVDSQGNIYIADTGNCVVRVVNKATQTISTLAGYDPSPTPYCGIGIDGVTPPQTPLNNPTGVAVDAAGNIYIADTGNGAVRMISVTTGLINTVAGELNSPGYTNSYTAATSTQLQSPHGIAVDGYGNLFIADPGNYTVDQVSPVTGYIVVVVGQSGAQGSPPAEGGAFGGGGTNFFLGNPVGVTVDSQGNVYIADLQEQGILTYSQQTTNINLISAVPGTPTSVSVDASDTLHFTLAGLCSVYKLPLGASTPIPIAGNGSCIPSGDGASALAAGLNNPNGVIADGTGSFYILEADGVRFVDSTAANTIPIPFGSQQIYLTSNPLSALLFNGDVQVPVGGTPNPLGVYFSGGLTAPFAVSPAATAPDCSTATTSVSIPLNPAAFCTLSMTFAPLTDGPFNSVTTLFETPVSSSAQVTQTFSLTGRGTGTGPTATLTPTSQNIAAGVDGGIGVANFTLTNTGSGAPLNITSIGFGDTSITGFTEANDCGSTLAQNAFCGITVSYAPTTAPLVNQTLVVTDNTVTGQTTAGLTGTGILPTATLSAAPGAFTGVVNEGGPTQSFTVTNTGAQGSLQVSYPYFNTLNGFYISITGNTCNNGPVAPGGSCTFSVGFEPTATGAATNTLIVPVNTTAASLMTAVSGTGTAPVATLSPNTTVTFTSTQAGAQSAQQTVMLTNSGNAPLNISGIVLNGVAPQDFTMNASACPAQLAINASCNIVVIFAPQAPGSYSATISITDDSGGERAGEYVTQTVPLNGTSPALVQHSSFTIADTALGTTPVGIVETQNVLLTINSSSTVLKSIAIAPGFTEWTVDSFSGCTVDGATANPSGTVCTIMVSFTPTQPGVHDAPLVVTTIESGVAVPYYFGLTATGTGPIAALTPGIIGPYVASDGSHGAANPMAGMGGPATAASVGFFSGIAIDGGRNMYVSDSEYAVVYKINPQGIISIYAGTPFAIGGYLQDMSGDGGLATQATLAVPGPLALDSAGNLYIGDTDYFGNERIREVNVGSGIITTVVGGGSGCSAQTDSFGDGCTGTQAIMNVGVGGNVTGLLFDNGGNLYFTATSAYSTGTNSEEIVNYAIRKWTPSTNVVSLFAGAVGNTEGTGADGGQAVGAKISPTTMALDAYSNLLVIDNGVQVRHITTVSPNIITTIAGAAGSTPIAGYGCTGSFEGASSSHSSGNGGLATAAKFCYLTGIAVDAANNVYLVDNSASEIRRIDSATGDIVEVAGQSSTQNLDFGDYNEQLGNNDGSARDASLATPIDLRLDGSANIYLLESWGNVRKINVSESALDFTPYFNPNPPYNREAVPIGSFTGPQQVTVVNAGNSGPVSFNTPFTSPTLFGISTVDYTRDTGAADCISTNAMLAPGAECPINIDFTPTVAGTPILDTDAINDTGGTQTITLIGYASGQAQVTLTPGILSFGGPINVTTPPQTFTLTNNTSASIGLPSISIIGVNSTNFATVNAGPTNCGPSLAANSSCNIAVTFTAPTVGNYIAQASVTYSQTVSGVAYNTTLYGNLTGIAGTPEGIFEIDQTEAGPGFFGDVNIGTTSPVHTFTFESTGNVPILITSAVLSGSNANLFNIVGNDCPASLAPTATCKVKVTFTPTSDSPGNPATPFTAALNMNDDAPDTAQQAFMNGYGVGSMPAVLNVSETVHTSDVLTSQPVAVLNISETVHTTDSPKSATAAQLNVFETVITSDVPDFAGQASQTITFTPPQSPVPSGTGPYTLQATASSSLAVSFSIVSGPGMISGNQLTITGIGTIIIAANQSGNAAYAPAPEVHQNVVAEVPPAIMDFIEPSLSSGFSSTPVPVTLSFTKTFTLGSLTTTTLGAPGTDFTVYSNGSCSPGTTYGPADSCTVYVVFTPSGPGLITGQLNALDTSGNTQFTANLASVRYR